MSTRYPPFLTSAVLDVGTAQIRHSMHNFQFDITVKYNKGLICLPRISVEEKTNGQFLVYIIRYFSLVDDASKSVCP